MVAVAIGAISKVSSGLCGVYLTPVALSYILSEYA